MSPIFKAISAGTALAILLIVIIHPQYIEYGYGLIIINILSIYAFSWLDQNSEKQTQADNQEVMVNNNNEVQVAIKNICSEMTDSLLVIMEQDKKSNKQAQIDNQEFIVNQNNKMQIAIKNICDEVSASVLVKMQQDKKMLQLQETAIAQLQKHTVQVAELLDTKLMDLTSNLCKINKEQITEGKIQQQQFVDTSMETLKLLTDQLAEQNKRGCDLMDSHLVLITDKFSPIFELVNQMKAQIKGNNDYMLERVSLMDKGQENLQSILSENGKQFAQTVSESLSVFSEEFEELLDRLSDDQRRQAEELNNLVKKSQNKQSDNLQDLTEEFRLVAQSQKDTQENVQQTLHVISQFNEELSELNQKDIKLLESLLNG